MITKLPLTTDVLKSVLCFTDIFQSHKIAELVSKMKSTWANSDAPEPRRQKQMHKQATVSRS